MASTPQIVPLFLTTERQFHATVTDNETWTVLDDPRCQQANIGLLRFLYRSVRTTSSEVRYGGSRRVVGFANSPGLLLRWDLELDRPVWTHQDGFVVGHVCTSSRRSISPFEGLRRFIGFFRSGNSSGYSSPSVGIAINAFVRSTTLKSWGRK